MTKRPYIRGSEEERFWPKVDKSGPCWLWTAATNGFGYGIFRTAEGRNVRAHRWAYEALVGPIADGLEVDHLCRVPACVNPAHLEPVTHLVNLGRAVPGRRVWRSERTHCKNGHFRTQENTRVYRGCQICKTCRNEQDRARRAR